MPFYVIYDPKIMCKSCITACWRDGESAPYLHLARTFNLLEGEKGKIKATSMLCNMFRRFLYLTSYFILWNH